MRTAESINRSRHLRCAKMGSRSCRMTFRCWSSKDESLNWSAICRRRWRFTSKSFNSMRWTQKRWAALPFTTSTTTSLKWRWCTTDECCRWDWMRASCIATSDCAACTAVNWIWFSHAFSELYDWRLMQNKRLTYGTTFHSLD